MKLNLKLNFLIILLLSGTILIGLLFFNLFNQRSQRITMQKISTGEGISHHLNALTADLGLWLGHWEKVAISENALFKSELEAFRQEYLVSNLYIMDSLFSQNDLLPSEREEIFLSALDMYLLHPSDSILEQINFDPAPFYTTDTLFSDILYNEIAGHLAENNRIRRVAFGDVTGDLKELIALTERLNISLDAAVEEARASLVLLNRQQIWITMILVLLLTGVIGLGIYRLYTLERKNIDGIRGRLETLAKGDHPEPVDLDPLFRTVGGQIDIIVDELSHLKNFAHNVGSGDFDTNIQVFDEKSEMGISLREMRESLQNVSRKEQERSWLNRGIGEFADLLRRESDLSVLCDKALQMLIRKTETTQGVIYLIEESDGKQVLNMRSLYANNRKKYLNKTLEKGQSLAGQCWVEQDIIHIKNAPDGYTEIQSGLGDATPRNIVIIPLINNEEINGVIEIASLKPISNLKIEYLKEAAESLSATVSMTYINEQTRKLLDESQMNAEQMQAQEEEMRQNMEELQATQEESARKTSELEQIISNYREKEVAWENQIKELKQSAGSSQNEPVAFDPHLLSTLESSLERTRKSFEKFRS